MMKTPGLAKLATLTLTLGMATSAFSMADRAADRLGERAVRHLEQSKKNMQLSPDDSFAMRGVDADELGQAHVRINQSYKGVPVFEGDLIVHMNRQSGEVLEVTDSAVRVKNLDVRARVSQIDAVAIARSVFQPLGAMENEPTARLVIFQKEDGEAALAWHVHAEVENDFETRHQDFMIDAKNGGMLKTWNTLMEAGATGTGNSQYSGTVALATNSVTGGFELRDTTRGTGGNYTLNLNKRTSGGSIFTDADNVWGDGQNYNPTNSTTSANGQTAAVDAHFGLQQTWDYYKNVHGRNGIDNAGKATYNRVHYSRTYDNAFWSDSCFCMTYGDGSSFKVLTAIDVAGHEMSHGVCSRTANLTYSGESGGLNESNSDIFGTMVEYYTRPTTANYLIGEQLYKTSGALRYMYKPSLDGASPDCYTSSVGTLDVHYSSGIGNRFFYFLAEGTTTLSGAGCNGATFSGIGRAAAEKIWYRALTVYMTSSTKYAGARTATLNAARDLYGTGSAEYNAVAAAWSAVNVN